MYSIMYAMSWFVFSKRSVHARFLYHMLKMNILSVHVLFNKKYEQTLCSHFIAYVKHVNMVLFMFYFDKKYEQTVCSNFIAYVKMYIGSVHVII